MTGAVSSQTIQELWHSFKAEGPSGRDEITVDSLREVMRSLGYEASDEDLRHILHDVDASGSISFEKFAALVTALRGDTESRLRIAFDVFDGNGDGLITADELRAVLDRFGLSDAELKQVFDEADRDGDGAIDFDDFCRLMPQEQEAATDRYRAASVLLSAAGCRQVAPAEDAREEPPAPAEKGGSRRRPHLHHPHGEPGLGTSRLQMQIGLFRLLQGAAYRSFRESYAANYETHLRAKKLPYTITHFRAFVGTAIALYKALAVVEEACFPTLDAVTDSLEAEFSRLQARIETWEALDKTPEMQAAASAMRAQRSQSAIIREKFAAGVEFALTLRKKDLGLADLVEDLLAVHELNRLRRLELHRELAPSAAHDGSDPRDYLKAWNRVLLDSAEEDIDGAIMPAAYWYEDFMPKLLAACSVATAEDVAGNSVPDEAALDRWFAAGLQAGEFAHYGRDVAAHFADCSPRQKLAIRQAWRLTRHYLNGVQKRRERQDFGRESGSLSQYVAFLDVYLGRNDVRQAEMRVSFPYYLGPATWRFLHTAAEIVCSQAGERQSYLIGLFKDFFRLFATMYPCPYCRYHLNAYVVQNREVDLYPIEYLVHGWTPDHGGFEVSIDDHLAAVTDGPSLRLFLWKLHNTVSASIARTEPWYHKDEEAIYTSRHWPGIAGELARARALDHDSISIDRLSRVHALLKPKARLAFLHRDLLRLLESGDASGLAAACDEAAALVADLEAALLAGAFLEQTYSFDPNLEDDAPHFTPEEEAFGRSGIFIEA